MILVDGRPLSDLSGAEKDALIVDLAAERDLFARFISPGMIRAKPDYQVIPSRSRVADPTKVPEVVA